MEDASHLNPVIPVHGIADGVPLPVVMAFAVTLKVVMIVPRIVEIVEICVVTAFVVLQNHV